MKKRNCRKTDEEREIHDKAVKLRKMTDAQLVEKVETAFNKGYHEGFKNASSKVGMTYYFKEFTEMLYKIKGIGNSTIWKIKKAIGEAHES